MKTNRILIATTLIALMATGCNKNNTHTSDGNTNSAIKVTVATSQTKEYNPELRYTGTAEANKEVNLGSAIPGRVEKINYQKGSFVPKGGIIVEMSDEMLIQAQIELEAIRKDFERVNRLKEKGSMSIMDYDHIKAKFEASQTKVDMLKKNTSITAPFGGVITDIMINEGENASIMPSLGDDLKVKGGVVTLMQLNPLKVSIEVNEKELSSVAKGQSVDLYFDAYPDEIITGKVSYISPILSSMSRTSTVEITVPNNNTKLKPGMYCRTSIEMPLSKGVFVPVNALYRQQGTGDNYIFIVNSDNTVSRKKVTRGEALGTLIHVPELDENSTVVVDGKNKLDDGATIEIVK